MMGGVVLFGKFSGLMQEMRALTNGAPDFQRAFREVWAMPYVVLSSGGLKK